MTMSLRLGSLCCVICMLIGCRSTPQPTVKATPPGTLPLEERIPLGVPAGSITFVGRIIAISDQRSADTMSACATQPCVARVHIVSVMMVGVKGPTNILDGDVRMMLFPMTLQQATYQGAPYSGLQEGDTFQGVGYEIATMNGMMINVERYARR